MTYYNSDEQSEKERVRLVKKAHQDDVKAKKASLPERKKRKAHIGARHAVYAFLWSLLIQLILLLPLLFIEITKQLTQNNEITEESILASFYDPQMLFWVQLASYAVWFTFGIIVSWRLGLKSLAKDFWFRFRWVQDISLGIAIAVGLRAAEMLIFWILGDVLKLDLSAADNTSAFTQGTGIWTYLLLIVVVSIIGPLSEEFLFRGMLLQGLIRTFRRKTYTPRTWLGEEVQMSSPKTFAAFVKYKEFLYKHKYVLAVIISSLCFGLMHYQAGPPSFGQFIIVAETGAIGLIFALIVLRTRRLGLAIFAHMAFNASGAILAMMQLQ